MQSLTLFQEQYYMTYKKQNTFISSKLGVISSPKFLQHLLGKTVGEPICGTWVVNTISVLYGVKEAIGRLFLKF